MEPEHSSVVDDLDQCCSLSRRQARGSPARAAASARPHARSLPQRLYGWAACFALGTLLSIIVRLRARAERPLSARVAAALRAPVARR